MYTFDEAMIIVGKLFKLRIIECAKVVRSVTRDNCIECKISQNLYTDTSIVLSRIVDNESKIGVFVYGKVLRIQYEDPLEEENNKKLCEEIEHIF